MISFFFCFVFFLSHLTVKLGAEEPRIEENAGWKTLKFLKEPFGLDSVVQSKYHKHFTLQISRHRMRAKLVDLNRIEPFQAAAEPPRSSAPNATVVNNSR